MTIAKIGETNKDRTYMYNVTIRHIWIFAFKALGSHHFVTVHSYLYVTEYY
jgi:hypothetical protein